MRIVDRATFLALPSGTLFAKFNPHTFGAVQIKADTCGEDFVCNELIPQFEGWDGSESYLAVLDAMMAGESSPPFDYDSYGRDGLFEREQLFAVFERRDHEALIRHLQEALDSLPAPSS